MGGSVMGERTGKNQASWWWTVVFAICFFAGVGLACMGDDGEGTSTKKTTNLQCDREGIASCSRGGGCADPALACSGGCCLPRCTDSSECVALTDCGEMGCECDAGVCQVRVCSADADCGGGQLCGAGVCVQPPAIAEVARCELSPSYGVSRRGVATGPLALQLYDADGAPMPLLAGPITADSFQKGLQLRSSSSSRGAVGTDGGLVGGAEAGPYHLTATVGSASCVSQRINFSGPAEGELRVVAIDELSGLPVEGATVQIVSGDQAIERITAEDGAALFSLAELEPGPRIVSVFHHEFMYLTLVGSEGEDLLLPLRRSIPRAGVGGFRGSFDPASFDPSLLNAGLVGMSIPGNLVDLSFTLLLGPVERIRVELGSAREVDVPRGIVLGLGNTWFKADYEAMGMAGVCADRDRTREGRCGTWSAWGLAGGMPLEELPLDELTESGSRLDVGQLLAHLLPQVKSFKSAIVRNVEIGQGRGEGGDAKELVELDLQPHLRLGLHPDLLIPTLPSAAGSVLDGVIALGGALHPQRGFVPLGITAGVDSGVAAGGPPSFEVVQPGGTRGMLQLRLAPLHGGLEGSRYAVIAIAANLSRLMEDASDCVLEDRSDCVAIAAVIRVQERIEGGAPVDLRPGGFVGFADGALVDAASRRFAQNGDILGEPNLMRLTLGGPSRRWTLYYPSGVREFPIPQPPLGFEDRSDGARASLQAMRVDATFEEVQGFGPKGLRHLPEVTAGFSSADLPRSK